MRSALLTRSALQSTSRSTGSWKRSGTNWRSSTRCPSRSNRRRCNRAPMTFRSQIVGCGAYLPERIVTNNELATRLDTSDAWIRQRTGIGERRIAADGELTSDLAYYAARQALKRAGMSGNDLDLLVLTTATPAQTFPATAVKLKA